MGWPRAYEVAAKLGVVEQVDGLRLVQELVPKHMGASTPNTYSGNFGYGAFPLHTDLAHWSCPPRYLVLRCVVGNPAISTRVLDGDVLVERIGASALGRCLVRPRRPLAGGLHLLHVLEHRELGPRFLLRWDSLYLQPANAFANATFERVKDGLSTVRPTEHTLVNRGDTLVIDNWRMLHGRAPVSATSSSREVHRIYLRMVFKTPCSPQWCEGLRRGTIQS